MVKLDLSKKHVCGELTRSRLERYRKEVENLFKREISKETKTFGKALVGLIDRYLERMEEKSEHDE